MYRDYIHRSTRRYRNVIQKAGRLHITDPRHLTAILWNDGLYFELHELLETFWLETHGNERTALKGLIQAAGVYVHSLRGNLRAARGLACARPGKPEPRIGLSRFYFRGGHADPVPRRPRGARPRNWDELARAAEAGHWGSIYACGPRSYKFGHIR